MNKKKLIEVLWELYRLNRSMNCNSSYGFYFSMKSLQEIDNQFFKDHWNELSEDPYKVPKIGSHIQDVINDYESNKYTRLFNTKRDVLELGKLDQRIYDVKDRYISRRLPIDIIKRYLKILKFNYRNNIKFGRGKSDKYRTYGVGSVTLFIPESKLRDYITKLDPTYRVIRLKKKEAWFIRNDHTEFLIILKVK